ncbi:RnfABCDGE type electron transport complex subunit B [Mobilitalea sibirica]|uniref:Ion-translocating oxidoreductase complex subunit B n=1 Tax=Mobilitalea sibirica TaxID=1462919 RepID=A0A8J7HBK1_9FIRM|nr:RnfABCDGE type electron transport complex subunit B [Mobilitalea sibirica]MBH1941186.1 RnfABCDGE type electron transport complex subunit B [Mobilitalea sibirica]
MLTSTFLPGFVGAINAVDLQGVGVATAIVGATGLAIGVFLGIAGKKLSVEVDEKELQVRELLPGANCGACGYPGCDGLAKAIAAGTSPVNACPVANQEAYDQIAAVMGTESASADKMVAYVKCAGTCDKTEVKYEYYGVKDCKSAALLPGKGNKKCSYGCMGFGSCVRVCAFDAIHIVNGIAVVDKEKCASCEKCVAECPNNIIEMVPAKAKTLVACSSMDKGKDVKAACSAGCIGCKLCVKNCEFDAIHVEDNLAYIDYSKCTNCGKCAAVCPVKVIEVQQDNF